MGIYITTQKKKSNHLKGNTHFEGMSIEREMNLATTTGKKPDQCITNIFYTRKQDGALTECNIRTDRFDVGQNAMTQRTIDLREKIKTKMQTKAE